MLARAVRIAYSGSRRTDAGLVLDVSTHAGGRLLCRVEFNANTQACGYWVACIAEPYGRTGGEIRPLGSRDLINCPKEIRVRELLDLQRKVKYIHPA